MNFNVGNYLKIMRLAVSGRPNRKLFTIRLSTLQVLAGWSFVNAAFQQLDRVLYPEAAKTPIPAPVFITGAARSGTTFFHRLLCLDDEHFEHFRFWEIALPSVTQKKLARRGATLLTRVAPRLTQAIEDWEQRQFDSVQQLHKFGFNMPEEDEFLFLMPFASATITVLFPCLDELQHLVMLDEQPDEERERLMKFYRECVEAQLYVHGGDRTLLSKNPAFVGKIKSVSEEFPDGKFVYLVRDPLETIPSVVNLLQTAWRGLGVQEEDILGHTPAIVASFVRDYQHAYSVLKSLPAERYAIVLYEDLVCASEDTVRRVYAELGLPVSESFSAKLHEACQRAADREPKAPHDPETFGIDVGAIRGPLRPMMEELGIWKSEERASTAN
ncbi:MAG: sulfotransferase [Myxococcales bacterium]|nr:MAG: sulfotransferase [Myxococcales bacterium]